MAPNVTVAEQALLALAPHDRAAVIHAGLLSLDDASVIEINQAEVDAAWRDEFRRRIDDIETGKVTLVSAAESQARVRALLAELHR
jgi:putative addiction module component (TIGR02574 family)